MHLTKNTTDAKSAICAWCYFGVVAIAIAGVTHAGAVESGPLCAGAAVVDATPTAFPVIVNGMFGREAQPRLTIRSMSAA